MCQTSGSLLCIFDSISEGKTRGIVGHLKADQDPTGQTMHLVLHVKDHTLKDNPVFFLL